LEKVESVTRLKSLKYDLLWTERATLSRRSDFRIIPSDTIPTDLTPEARTRMLQAIEAEREHIRTYIKEHNPYIQ
jgi:hypothetical protein